MPGIEDQQAPLAPFSLPAPQVIPAATPAAVEQLLQAERESERAVIEDAARTSGSVVQAQRQQAREFISPEAIATRRAVTLRTQAEANDKQAYDRYLQSGRPLPRTPTGDVDNLAVLAQGGELLQADEEMKTAMLGLQGQPMVISDEKGNPIRVMQNILGENVSYGSPAWKRYQEMISHATKIHHKETTAHTTESIAQPKVDLDQAFGPPGGVVIPATTPAAPVTAPVKPVVQPKIPSAVGPLTDWTQPLPGLPGGGPPQVTVTPAPVAGTAAVAKAAVVPKTTPTPGLEYRPGFDITGGVPYSGDLPKAQEMMKDVRSQEFYKNWSEKHPAINTVRDIASRPRQKISTQDDIDLANAVIQLTLMGTGGMGRGTPELRVRSLEEAQPILERIDPVELKGLALKEHAFTSKTRDRLLQVAQRRIASIESDARSTLQQSAGLISRTTYAKPQDFLNSAEMGLFQGTQPAVGGARSGGSTEITLGGKRYQIE